jgi:hypothetical protein
MRNNVERGQVKSIEQVYWTECKREDTTVNINFYVSLTVHHDVNQFSVTNLMHLVFYSVICYIHITE